AGPSAIPILRAFPTVSSSSSLVSPTLPHSTILSATAHNPHTGSATPPKAIPSLHNRPDTTSRFPGLISHWTIRLIVCGALHKERYAPARSNGSNSFEPAAPASGQKAARSPLRSTAGFLLVLSLLGQ